MTKVQLDSLISTNSLIKGETYEVTDCNISLTSDLENGCVRVECDNTNAVGLIGSHDFTENVSPLSFPQAKSVENKIQEAISNL